MKNPKLVEEALIDMIEVLGDDSKIDAYLETHNQETIEEAFNLIEEKGLGDYVKSKSTELKDKLKKRYSSGLRARQKVKSAELAGLVNKGLSTGDRDKKVKEFRTLLYTTMVR